MLLHNWLEMYWHTEGTEAAFCIRALACHKQCPRHHFQNCKNKYIKHTWTYITSLENVTKKLCVNCLRLVLSMMITVVSIPYYKEGKRNSNLIIIKLPNHHKNFVISGKQCFKRTFIILLQNLLWHFGYQRMLLNWWVGNWNICEW